MVWYIALAAALTGLFTSTYIYRKKRKKTRLICPLRANCDKVVHSTYATTGGVSNEVLGVTYYCVLSIVFALFAFFPGMFISAWLFALAAILALCGVLFSFYLIAVQALILEAWCSWCMLSVAANITLFLCVFLPYFLKS